jgi:hypothetical protein
MENQWWLYWAFDREWWLSATQGSVGALIAFVGLFVSFKLTQWWEKRKTVDQRSMEGIASVLQASLKVISEHPHNQAEAMNLTTELILFSSRESADHPQTGRWAIEHAYLFGTYAEDKNNGELLRNQAARVGGSLMRWAIENRADGDLDPNQVHVNWAVAIREVGIEPEFEEPVFPETKVRP